MKKKYIYSIILSLTLCFGACTNLDEKMYSYIDQDDYGKTPEELASLIGPAYGTMVTYVNYEFWMQQVATDEYMIPSKGINWLSEGIHALYHKHEWTPAKTPNLWKFTEVITINKIIDLLEKTTVEVADKERIFAELRVLRAFWYFHMLDNLGNVPIVTKFEEGELPTNNTRKEVYDFVEKELLESLPDLTDKKTPQTYAKVTKWVAHSILAKLYLNAEVYTGTPQWKNCMAQCDSVIDSQLYKLEPNIFDNFKVKNEGSKENIWCIPYQAGRFTASFNAYQMSWHYSDGKGASFPVTFETWNGPCAVPSFVHSFDKDDTRYGSFLIGPRFKPNGNPVYLSDGVTQLDYIIDFPTMVDSPENAGARLFKWEVETGGISSMSNDWAVFRYSDILLMKAECFLRTGFEPDARTLVNDVRRRNFSPEKPLPLLTLDLLLAERGFEFVFEGWRRNDQIRFDTFGGTWSFKPDADPADKHTYLFPIPKSVLDKNPNLKQNPGYPR